MEPSAYDEATARLRAAPRTWLVTGAAGFIGSHVVEELLRLGQRVVGLDNFCTGNRGNLAWVERAVGGAAYARFSLVAADVRDPESCNRACAEADFVVHHAALGSVPRSIEHPADTYATNVDGTRNVLLAAARRPGVRVVYASSSSVYGDHPALPQVEACIGRPLSPYAASKQRAERCAAEIARERGLWVVGLRYFNVVGPRQASSRPYAAVVPRWTAALMRGERCVVFGDGATSRDFCPVQNVVQATLLAATADCDAAGRVYNVGLGGRTTLDALHAMLRDGLARRGYRCAEEKPLRREFRPGDLRHTQASLEAVCRDLGYAPSVDLAAGLDAALDAIVDRGAGAVAPRPEL